MHVQELMTAPVLYIGPEAALKDAAAMLVERGISGLPVCDDENRVIGVISEGDILYKEHDPTVGRKRGPLAWLAGGNDAALLKSRAVTVREAMTSPPITISPWSSVAEAARLMTERGVNRLPVVKDGELVGILTRTDVVRAFTRSDEEIARELREEVLERTLWLESDTVRVEVNSGVVTLGGMLQTRSDVMLLEGLATRVPGVVSVESDLRWNVDDMGRRGRPVAGRARL
jgi:CBS domain-containing protein